jgi:hypothetical protein
MEPHTVHSHVKEKHFKHYLFEFFMLFLAVTLGFFVENQREHIVEHQREKQFVTSMVTDLQTDIVQLDSIIKLRHSKTEMIDSILLMLDSNDPDKYGSSLYYFARRLPRAIKFFINDGTLQQLKYAGNLRLIQNKRSVDGIMRYDQTVRNTKASEDREESLILQSFPSIKSMFDPRVFEKMVDGMKISRPEGNPHLLIKDKQHITELYSHIHFIKNANTYHTVLDELQKEVARETLRILKDEYKIQENNSIN